MPNTVLPSTRFHRWALPKLRPLEDAQAKDAGTGHPYYLHRLLTWYMAEYEEQPFAQHHDARTRDAMRQSARLYLRNHSNPAYHPHLDAYEAAGHASEDCPFDACTATELWAAMEQPLVRQRTCVELGIPADTASSHLPDNYIRVRKVVVNREFSALSEAEKATWRELAAARKQAMARGETDVIAVQDLQENISRDIAMTLADRLEGLALGETLVVTYQGCYTNAESKDIRHFHGQISTLPLCPLWFESRDYAMRAKPAWKTFAHRALNKQIVGDLDQLPEGATGNELKAFRDDLELLCEELFRLQGTGLHFNRTAFWELVDECPRDFVAPERMPLGVVFGNPQHMEEPEFCAFYKHVWLCQTDRNAVSPDLRFVYKPEALNLFVALCGAQKLKAYWDAVKQGGSELAAAAGPGVTSNPTVPDVDFVDAAVFNADADADTDADPFDADVFDAAGLGAAVINAHADAVVILDEAGNGAALSHAPANGSVAPDAGAVPNAPAGGVVVNAENGGGTAVFNVDANVGLAVGAVSSGGVAPDALIGSLSRDDAVLAAGNDSASTDAAANDGATMRGAAVDETVAADEDARVLDVLDTGDAGFLDTSSADAVSNEAVENEPLLYADADELDADTGAFDADTGAFDAYGGAFDAAGASQPPNFAAVCAGALANTMIRRVRRRLGLADAPIDAALPDDDAAVPNGANPAAPSAVDEPPNKRGLADAPEAGSKATKRRYEDDATARRTDGM